MSQLFAYNSDATLNEIIQPSIVWTMSKAWNLHEDERRLLLSDLEEHEHAMPGWTGHLPSDNNGEYARYPTTSQKTLTQSIALYPQTLPSNPKSTLLTLHWATRAPKYTNDLDTYIWQTFTKTPQLDYLKLRILPRPNGDRVFMVLKTGKMLAAFREQHRALVEEGWASQSDKAASDPLFLLAVICTQIRGDLVRFLDQSAKQMNLMVT